MRPYATGYHPLRKQFAPGRAAGHPRPRQAFAPWLNRVTVPTLNVAGWWDQEDFYGPIKIYELLEKHDTRKDNFLVVGPWNHGGWSRGTGRTLGHPLPPQRDGHVSRALPEGSRRAAGQ